MTDDNSTLQPLVFVGEETASHLSTRFLAIRKGWYGASNRGHVHASSLKKRKKSSKPGRCRRRSRDGSSRAGTVISWWRWLSHSDIMNDEPNLTWSSSKGECIAIVLRIKYILYWQQDKTCPRYHMWGITSPKMLAIYVSTVSWLCFTVALNTDLFFWSVDFVPCSKIPSPIVQCVLSSFNINRNLIVTLLHHLAIFFFFWKYHRIYQSIEFHQQ